MRYWILKYAEKIFRAVVYGAAVFLAIAFFLLAFFNLPIYRWNSEAELGVTFSKRYAEDIMLDWKQTYLAVLDELKVKKIRIPVYWDLVEKEEGVYDFSDIDWQLDEAQKRNAEIILAIGQKVPRWPECAIPDWAEASDEKRKESLMKYLPIVVERYKNHPAVRYWQVENEPYLPFGICPAFDEQLFDRELALVRQLDPSRKILLTDSGELSLWVSPAKRADVFGTTMYRTIWNPKVGFFEYPVGPRFFIFKYWMIQLFADQKNAIVVELQAEPWIDGWVLHTPIEKQLKNMNEKKLVEYVNYARKTDFPEIYLWGVEWWYWMKNNQNHPELWETAKKLFNE